MPKATKEKTAKRTKTGIFTLLAAIACLLLLPLIIINSILIVRSIKTPGFAPSVAGYTPLIVQTGSMEPAIQTGDLLLTKQVASAESIGQGDVIAYYQNNGIVSHRVVDIAGLDGETYFYTQGDANNTEDPVPVPYSSVIGSYALRIPKIGGIALFLQTPVGMLVCLAVPIGLFGLGTLLGRRRNKKASRYKPSEV